MYFRAKRRQVRHCRQSTLQTLHRSYPRASQASSLKVALDIALHSVAKVNFSCIDLDT